jgi:hypothetical protein
MAGAANARIAITAPRGPADSGCWSVMRLNAAALQSGEMSLQTPCLNATLQGGLQPGVNQRAALVDYGADAGGNCLIAQTASLERRRTQQAALLALIRQPGRYPCNTR